MTCIEAGVESGRKRQNFSALFVDAKVQEVPVMFVENE